MMIHTDAKRRLSCPFQYNGSISVRIAEGMRFDAHEESFKLIITLILMKIKNCYGDS